jgi:chromosome segregation ATPase
VNGNSSTNGNISASDFQPGAIVRVTVENFVTYEKAEFFPGPNLNMVIGPNGTGKSSLVCAICLGLGYSPKHLGRAGSVKEFVKHGKDTATIEIELQKKPKDRSNYVIRVVIRREQNNQKWWLNGKETTHKAIQTLMRSLKIQVDNLCQFLPQDRVSEFAASTPVDLLRETLRAAAPEQMLRWQKQLQDLHKDKKGLSEASQADVATLQNLQSRQQGLQADVDRLREREEIQERVGNLQSALVLAQYQQARENNNQAKERRKEAERALKRLERESGPSLEAVNRKQEYAQQVEAAVSGRTQALSGIMRQAEELGRQVHTAGEDIKEFENKQDSERKGFDERKKEVAASRSKITALQADLKNRPSDFNAADWNQKIVGVHHTCAFPN